MAYIDGKTPFNADQLSSQVIGIALDVGKHDSGMHQHQKAQLLYIATGCISLTLDGRRCVLPPTRAAWIPAAVTHCAQMRNVVAYRSVYFSAEIRHVLPNSVKIIHVSPLLKELIERMSFWPWDKKNSEQENTIALFCEELAAAPEDLLQLPLPQDKRLQPWLKKLTQEGQTAPPLNEMPESIGAGTKTISRIFSRETGMPYQSWRQQWRLLSAVERLAEGASVADAAYALEFSSDSAFISFFKKHTGQTPAQYMK